MAGETDLARAGKPVLVGDLATADELGVQQLQQGAQLPVLLRRNSTADTDERLRPRHCVDHVVARAVEQADPARGCYLDVTHRWLRSPGGIQRQDAGPEGDHLHLGGRLDGGDEAASEGGLPRHETVAVDLEVDCVPGEAGVEARGRPSGNLAPPRRARPEHCPERDLVGEPHDVACDLLLGDSSASLPAQVDDLVSPEAAEALGIGLVAADRDHASARRRREPCGGTEQLSCNLIALRLDEHHDGVSPFTGGRRNPGTRFVARAVARLAVGPFRFS